MTHKFNPKNWERLESQERRDALPPDQVLIEIGLKPGQTMVDVGVGTGLFAIPAAKKVGLHGKIYAVDISAEMLSLVAQRSKDQMLPIELVRSQETRVPLDDEIADHVFLSAVFHEIMPNDRVAFLTEMARLMKPTGILTILDWAPVSVRTIGPPLDERLSTNEVEETLRETSLQIERSQLLGEHFYMVQGRKRVE